MTDLLLVQPVATLPDHKGCFSRAWVVCNPLSALTFLLEERRLGQVRLLQSLLTTRPVVLSDPVLLTRREFDDLRRNPRILPVG